jgi:hypothetical protein
MNKAKTHMLSYQQFVCDGQVFNGLSSLDQAYDFAKRRSSFGHDTRMKHLHAYIIEGKKEIRWFNKGVALFKWGIMHQASGSLQTLPRLRVNSLVGSITPGH